MFGFFNDWLLQQLIESGDQKAVLAYQRWATHLNTDNPSNQEAVACYTLAVQGWAQFMQEPPALADANDDTHAAWECYGAIIFWMHRPGLTPAEVRGQCAPYWQRLQNELLPAAADPLYRLRNANHFPYEEGPHWHSVRAAERVACGLAGGCGFRGLLHAVTRRN